MFFLYIKLILPSFIFASKPALFFLFPSKFYSWTGSILANSFGLRLFQLGVPIQPGHFIPFMMIGARSF